jgi:hypothetical protein
MPVSFEDVREFAIRLPRTTEGVVRGIQKLYVGRIVYIAFERDGVMGFAFPREWRETAVASEPEKYEMPTGGDLRYNWLLVHLEAIGPAEMRELVTDAWSMVVPQKVIDAYLAGSS